VNEGARERMNKEVSEGSSEPANKQEPLVSGCLSGSMEGGGGWVNSLETDLRNG